MKFFILISLFAAQSSLAALPTDAQMARVKKVMEATVQVQKLAKKILDSQAPSLAGEPSDEMLKTINQPDCKVVVTKPKDDPQNPSGGSGVDVRDAKVEVLGEKCALNLLAEVKAQKAGNDVTYTITVNYVSNSDELKKLIDVDRMAMTGPGSVKVVTSQTGMSADVQMTYGGVVHSQTEGDVSLGVKMNQQITIDMSQGLSMSQKMQTPMEIKFSDFSVLTTSDVELANGAAIEKYTVNGEAVTKQVYDSVTAGFKVFGANEEEI